MLGELRGSEAGGVIRCAPCQEWSIHIPHDLVRQHAICSDDYPNGVKESSTARPALTNSGFEAMPKVCRNLLDRMILM